MFNADLLQSLNDAAHPPRLTYSPMILVNQDDLMEDSPVPAFDVNGMEPIELKRWELFRRSDQTEAMGSESFERVVGQAIPAPILVGCRVLSLWVDGAYKNVWLDVFDTPLSLSKGYPILRGRVMITEYNIGTGPLFKFEIVPLFTKRRR